MPRWPTRTFEERFWSHIDRSGGPDKCWPWTGASNKARVKRYGCVRGQDYNGNGGKEAKRRSAHRVALQLATGIAGTGSHAAHDNGCTTSLCCNPAHLRWTTCQDNNLDVAEKKHLKKNGVADP